MSTSSVGEVITNTINNENNNVNNVVNKLTNNVNNVKPITPLQVNKADIIADKLEVALKGGAESRAFYCKVAYKLPEYQIWNNLEQASRGNYPQKYFTWLCKKDMEDCIVRTCVLT